MVFTAAIHIALGFLQPAAVAASSSSADGTDTLRALSFVHAPSVRNSECDVYM